MKRFLTVLVAWLLSSSAVAGTRYWDADYDSLARTLPQQPTDTARLRTLVHLLDLHPTNAQALPLLDRLLALNAHLHTLDARPYVHLHAGLLLWYQNNAAAHAAALDTMQAAVVAFDRTGRPIPWLLMDLVTLFNRLNRMAARKHYYEGKLAQYRLHGATTNMAACYVSQGGYYRRMGDYNRTLNNILRAADLAQTFSQVLYVRELVVAGSVYADWGNRAKAGAYLRGALARPEFRHIQGQERVFTFLALSRLSAQEGRYPEALHSADSALATPVADPYDEQVGRAYGLVQRASILLQMQQAAPAGRLLLRAQRLNDSLNLPMSGKPGECELDATWAAYYQGRHDYVRAANHLRLAYQRATAAKLGGLRTKYLKQLAAFYHARGNPVEAERYARAYIALADTSEAAQSSFRVAQYEGERVEQAQNAQITDLRQAQAVQAVRLRLRNRLLLGGLLALLLIAGLGLFSYQQLHLNRQTLAQLRQTQSQLVQAEKMAFLGELTAGIAHELQNPLNFMKNFAEVSTELVDDIHGEGTRHDAGLERDILVGLKQNLQQISQHGQRASSIIKDMLEHTRSGTGPRLPSDLNALADESLTLAYESLCTQHKEFRATLDKEFDPQMGSPAVVSQDLGRVLLNLCTNALYAVRQRQQQAAAGAAGPARAYVPTVTISTRRASSQAVEIRVCDNGTGISDHVKTKVFEPFFTTKPPGEGTGLGLSLSYDIITKGHGGTLTVESREGVGTEFLITLPA